MAWTMHPAQPACRAADPMSAMMVLPVANEHVRIALFCTQSSLPFKENVGDYLPPSMWIYMIFPASEAFV